MLQRTGSDQPFINEQGIVLQRIKALLLNSIVYNYKCYRDY
jgi:hypothetical protein